jgi:hypothetical protein
VPLRGHTSGPTDGRMRPSLRERRAGGKRNPRFLHFAVAFAPTSVGMTEFLFCTHTCVYKYLYTNDPVSVTVLSWLKPPRPMWFSRAIR